MTQLVWFQHKHGVYESGEKAGLPDGEAATLEARGLVSILGPVADVGSSHAREVADDVVARLGSQHYFAPPPSPAPGKATVSKPAPEPDPVAQPEPTPEH